MQLSFLSQTEMRREKTQKVRQDAFAYQLQVDSFTGLTRKVFPKSAFINSPICPPLAGSEILCWLGNELL